jgi:hypothetical protein
MWDGMRPQGRSGPRPGGVKVDAAQVVVIVTIVVTAVVAYVMAKYS